MHTKYYYNRSPSPAVKINKSYSSEHFYKPNSTRSMNYHLPSRFQTKQCRGCHVQPQKNYMDLSSNRMFNKKTKISSVPNSQYYKTNDNTELINTKKSRRYLEQVLQTTRQQHKSIVSAFENKVQSLSTQLIDKNRIIEQLKKQCQSKLQLMKNQYSQQNLVQNSNVTTYLQENKGRSPQDQIKYLKNKNRQLLNKVNQFNDELQILRKFQQQNKKVIEEYMQKESKYAEYQIYKKQYESMRLLINKIQNDKQGLQKLSSRQIKQTQEVFRKEIQTYKIKNQQFVSHLQQKDRQIQMLNRQIIGLKEQNVKNIRVEHQKMQEMIDEKDSVIDQLEYKIRCIQADINFMKNKYGHLLVLAKSNTQLNFQEQVQGVQQSTYGMDRAVGRFNPTTINPKQSMLGMNMSPIKKR